MVQRALDRSGFSADVSVAQDGDEALRALAGPAPEFDLVLLDLHLPRRSGLEVLASLGEKTRRLPPIVVLTGSSSPAEADEARRLGAKSVVEVPCNLQALQSALQDVCRRYLVP